MEIRHFYTLVMVQLAEILQNRVFTEEKKVLLSRKVILPYFFRNSGH
jgi:hypothetical protein